MFVYLYECGTCGHGFDAWSKMDNRNDPRNCPQCPSLAERVLVPTPTQWNVKGSDPDFPSAYNRWATDRAKRYQRALKLEQ